MKRAVIAGGVVGVVLLSGLVLLRGQPPAAARPADAAKEAHTLRTSGSTAARNTVDGDDLNIQFRHATIPFSAL